MTNKKKSTQLKSKIEVGDIIKDCWIWTDGSDDEPDYYLILEELKNTYLVMMLETGEIFTHSFQYDPEIQYEKVG